MAPAPEIDAETFKKRAGDLYTGWKTSRATEWGNSDALCFVVGAADDDATYQRGTSLQMWLLGYELYDTITLVLADKIVFYAGSKRAAVLEPLTRKGGMPVEIITRTKDDAANAEALKQLLSMCAGSYDGKRLGGFAKDRYPGKLVTEWKNALKASDVKFEDVDVAAAVTTHMAVKDDSEIKIIRAAAKLTSLILKKHFVSQMMDVIDEGKQVKHVTMAEGLDNLLEDEEARKKDKLPAFDYEQADWCYQPIIQSGGKYDLRPDAESNNDPLHEGTVIASMGIRYKAYCSNIGRTFLLNPDKAKEKNYNFLLDLQEKVLKSMKDGVPCSEVYNTAISYITEKRPDLVSHFVKNCGWSMGIQFRESTYILGPKHSAAKLKTGMVMNVTVGFQNLVSPAATDSRSKTYALLLTDTVVVTDDQPIMLTDVKKTLEEVSFEFQEAEDEEPVKPEPKARPSRSAPSSEPKSKTKNGRQLREGNVAAKAENESKRNEHQKILHAKIQEEGLRKFQGGEDNVSDEQQQVFKKYASYKSDAQLPRTVQELKIVVDARSETIILPIYGQPVPFHVSTLKNVSKSEEGDWIYLRFNFLVPGVGKKELTQPFEDSAATFIKALSFRSSDLGRFMDLYKQINDLKKDTTKRDSERKEKADLVEQDNLIEIRGRRPLRLGEVYTRPLVDKRFPGDLELHQNGVRYQSQLKSGQKIDILFSNVRHVFFQPCDHELIVILHFHLKHHIMIGKKKTKDVQFYRDVTDAGYDETGGSRRRRANYGDEDELAMESEERMRRAKLNKEFHSFAQTIQEASGINVEQPFRDLSFHGVFSRQLVLIQPTTECLVHLTDMPNLVITLDDVLQVHFERIVFGLKNFDFVIIFKDYTRPVVHINTIPSSQLDNCKEWLDSVDIPFSEGQANLSWPGIMKTVAADPVGFFETGGWNFLQPESEDEGSEEEISEFEMSGSEMEASESEDSEGYSGGSNASEDEYSGSGSEVESGEDWDELEKKAERADKMRGQEQSSQNNGKRRNDDDDERRSSKKGRR
ncbi:FACT complex subunit spt16 [Thoreauomyces humboldtii]|nr:FACT complex subunit spt16 [Thoreauomyces humboldtii]